MIDKRLMSDEDLTAVTGWQRYSKQCQWFRERFGIEPVCADGGRPVVTWAVFEALQAKHFGVVLPGGVAPGQGKVELCFD